MKERCLRVLVINFLKENEMKGLFRRIKKVIKFLIEVSKSAPYLITSNNKIISKGKESYHNGDFTVKGKGILEIGSYCAIGNGVKVILSNHDFTKTCMQYSFYRKNFDINPVSPSVKTTIIENDVWIGDNVIILPGVSIGTGAVIGAASIVTKDVEPYTIVAGNPARPIKKRFTDDKINELLNSKWWEWDSDKIKRNKEFFT